MKRLLCKELPFLFISALSLLSGGALHASQTTDVHHDVSNSNFSPTGKNYSTYFDLNEAVDLVAGSFVLSCTDGVFLEYVNVLGNGELLRITIGPPNSEIIVKFSYAGEVEELSLIVSPSGLSFYGKALDAWTMDVLHDTRQFEFGFQLTLSNTDIFSQHFVLRNEDRALFLETAAACGVN